MNDETLPTRPASMRPLTGLLAWQATIGYISSEYSPDAMLTIQATPQKGGAIGWTVTASWGHHSEMVRDMPSVASGLRELWLELERHHKIFKTPEASIRRPAGYTDDLWLDVATQSILDRLIQVNVLVFNADWTLIIVYQPVETPNARVQTRLLARESTVHIGGRGPTLRDACHDLYRNAAQDFRQYK